MLGKQQMQAQVSVTVLLDIHVDPNAAGSSATPKTNVDRTALDQGAFLPGCSSGSGNLPHYTSDMFRYFRIWDCPSEWEREAHLDSKWLSFKVASFGISQKSSYLPCECSCHG